MERILQQPTHKFRPCTVSVTMSMTVRMCSYVYMSGNPQPEAIRHTRTCHVDTL